MSCLSPSRGLLQSLPLAVHALHLVRASQTLTKALCPHLTLPARPSVCIWPLDSCTPACLEALAEAELASARRAGIVWVDGGKEGHDGCVGDKAGASA